MSVEQAIVDFVVQGDSLASAAANKISADLTSAERAGRSAERAAQSAEGAAQRAQVASEQLAAGIQSTLGRLSQAANFAKTLGKAAGAQEGDLSLDLLDIAGKGFSGAGQGASLGAAAGSFVPGVGNAVGAVIGGTIGAGAGVIGELRRQSERDGRVPDTSGVADARALTDAARDLGGAPSAVDRALLDSMGLAKADSALRGGVAREVQ